MMYVEGRLHQETGRNNEPATGIQNLSSILEVKLCTKKRAKRWQAFMKSLNLL